MHKYTIQGFITEQALSKLQPDWEGEVIVSNSVDGFLAHAELPGNSAFGETEWEAIETLLADNGYPYAECL